MIPLTLEGWSLDIIRQIIVRGVFENEFFDIKEKLPDPRDESGKERIRKACAAFANSNSGFLVFGIKDDKELAIEDRIVGLDAVFDFPEKFGSLAAHVNPSIDWKFKNPAIEIGDNKVIHVVQINVTHNGPHCLSINNIYSFPKRTNKGNEEMSYLEIRGGFLNFYERKLKINLIRAELLNIARGCHDLRVKREKWGESYSLVSLNTSVIESLLPDVYLIIANDLELLDWINRLRSRISVLSNKSTIFFAAMSAPLINRSAEIQRHNEFVDNNANDILSTINEINLRLNKYCI